MRLQKNIVAKNEKPMINAVEHANHSTSSVYTLINSAQGSLSYILIVLYCTEIAEVVLRSDFMIGLLILV